MQKVKNLFGNINMSWKTVVLFAIFSGVYTGLINSIPLFDDTSFQDIAISYEWWVVFALIVVSNCKNPLEAGIKCFVFFLISQPLVYLVEIPFKEVSLQLAIMYYVKIWLPLTFATLFGGFIAYYVKKENILGSIILGIGESIIALMGIAYFKMAISDFPRHILTTIFCFVAVVVTTFCLKKKKSTRIITFSVCVFLIITIIIFAILTNRTI